MRARWLLPLLLLCGCPEDDEQSVVTPDAPGECQNDCSPDGPPPATPDAGPDAAPPADDDVVVSLDFAALPDDVEAVALAEVGDGEQGTPFAATTEDVFPVGPAVESAPGRETTMTFRWGTIPPDDPTSNVWNDYSGHIALSKGSIELLGTMSWAGDGDAASPPPSADFVARQTDPRVIRFRSWIRAGSDGVYLRMKKPLLEPVVVDVKIGPVRRQMAFEEFLATRTTIGGWNVPVGNVEWQAWVATPTAACYESIGFLDTDRVTYDAQQRTQVRTITAELPRDAARDAASLAGGDELRGPYALLTGTIGDRQFEGWYARYYVLNDMYSNGGALFGRLVAPDQSIELVAGAYDRGELLGTRVFRRVDCGAPGAMARNYFRF